MITESNTNTGPITREQWLEIVARNSVTPVRPHAAREHTRFWPQTGIAKLVFTIPCGTQTVPVVRTCLILDISNGGLAVKSEQMVPVRTGVGMDVDMEGEPLLLMGTVARCTSTVGGYQIGIKLVFPSRAPAGG